MADTTTSTTPEVCSLFTIKLALENLRTHALHVRDTAQGSAIQLAGPRVGREFIRKEETHPDQGINSHLLSLVDDIEAILRDCDDFADSILVLTGKWHQEQAEPQPSTSESLVTTMADTAFDSVPLDSRQEPTPSDESSIALQTGIADLVSTITGGTSPDKAA